MVRHQTGRDPYNIMLTLVNGQKRTEHPMALPLVVVSLPTLFRLQPLGLHLNVIMGGGRDNIFPGQDGVFALPPNLYSTTPIYVMGLGVHDRRQTTNPNTNSNPSTNVGAPSHQGTTTPRPEVRRRVDFGRRGNAAASVYTYVSAETGARPHPRPRSRKSRR